MPNPTDESMADADVAVSAHTHRWRIGAQAGAFSSGVCECGAEKEFPNSWDRETGRTWTSPSRTAR
jgi:hypothetical protein